MSEAQEELAGMGVGMEIPENISSEKIWQILLIKITQPNLFLPVTDVISRPGDDGRSTYREMSMGPNRIIENIYTDESIFEVNFDVVTDDTEIVNVILTDTATGKRTLEFYKRSSSTKERLHWAVPAKIGRAACDKIFEMARAL